MVKRLVGVCFVLDDVGRWSTGVARDRFIFIPLRAQQRFSSEIKWLRSKLGGELLRSIAPVFRSRGMWALGPRGWRTCPLPQARRLDLANRRSNAEGETGFRVAVILIHGISHDRSLGTTIARLQTPGESAAGATKETTNAAGPQCFHDSRSPCT